MAGRVVCVAVLLASTGCGTVANLAPPGPGRGGKVPFGGVEHDRACINRAAAGEVGHQTAPGPVPQPVARAVLTLLCAADLPLSVVGDVVTLPYTCGYTWINAPTYYPPLQLADPNAPAPPVQGIAPPPGPLAQPRALPPVTLPPLPPDNQPALPPQTPGGQPKLP